MEISTDLNCDSEFDQLLAKFEMNSAPDAQAIRGFARANPDQFLALGLNLFLRRPFSAALRCVGMTLIQDHRLATRVLQLIGQPQKVSIELIQKLMQCDPRFDLKLLHALREPDGNITADAVTVTRAIEILDRVSDSSHLVAPMRHMLDDPDSRIKSKAASFIGRRTQNLNWARIQLHDTNARVRANVVETIEGPSGPDRLQLIWKSVIDPDNRVVGNAPLNLYRNGETAALSLIFQMAERPEYEFRRTAAWLMGATGDARFATTLAGLLRDPENRVRDNAFRGLKCVKTAMAGSGAKPELLLSRVGYRQVDKTPPAPPEATIPVEKLRLSLQPVAPQTVSPVDVPVTAPTASPH